MKNNKKKMILGLSLAAVLGLGGTLAYLTATTNDKTNMFTMGPGITGETEEPKWDEKNATNFVPGDIIAKDPQIKNNSEGETSAYVGMEVTYQVRGANEDEWVATTYEELDKFINVKTSANVNTATTDDEIQASKDFLATAFNEEMWTLNTTKTTAVYKAALAPGETTKKLFTAVQIDPLALTKEQVDSVGTDKVLIDVSKYEEKDAEGNVIEYTYTTYQMQDFQIVVKGYMVQTDGFADAATALQTAFPEVFG